MCSKTQFKTNVVIEFKTKSFNANCFFSQQSGFVLVPEAGGPINTKGVHTFNHLAQTVFLQPYASLDYVILINKKNFTISMAVQGLVCMRTLSKSL